MAIDIAIVVDPHFTVWHAWFGYRCLTLAELQRWQGLELMMYVVALRIFAGNRRSSYGWRWLGQFNQFVDRMTGVVSVEGFLRKGSKRLRLRTFFGAFSSRTLIAIEIWCYIVVFNVIVGLLRHLQTKQTCQKRIKEVKRKESKNNIKKIQKKKNQVKWILVNCVGPKRPNI